MYIYIYIVSMFTCMIVGHSQLPFNIASEQSDISYEIFRVPGAQLKHITQHSKTDQNK